MQSSNLTLRNMVPFGILGSGNQEGPGDGVGEPGGEKEDEKPTKLYSTIWHF